MIIDVSVYIVVVVSHYSASVVVTDEPSAAPAAPLAVFCGFIFWGGGSTTGECQLLGPPDQPCVHGGFGCRRPTAISNPTPPTTYLNVSRGDCIHERRRRPARGSSSGGRGSEGAWIGPMWCCDGCCSCCPRSGDCEGGGA